MLTLHEDVQVLYRRDEVCLVEAAGVVIGMALTPLQPSWLPALVDVQLRAAERRRGPAPAISIFRLDERYPVRPGFDSTLEDLRQTLTKLRGTMTATALVIEFEGVIAITLRAMLASLGVTAPSSRPMSVHSSAVDGIRWLEPYLPAHADSLLRPGRLLRAVRHVRGMLGLPYY